MHRRAILPTLLAAVALAGTAAPATARDVTRSSALWATVNVCDSPARDNVIGIRGSMPGSGRTERLSMRFQVQYLDGGDGKWHNIAKGADSGFVALGTSRRRTLESGYSFTFEAPRSGKLTLRGAVTFRWSRKGRTVRRVRELTEAGHRSTRGADPPSFSAARCELG